MTRPIVTRPRGGTLDLENGRVEMIHGAGGRATAQLIDEIFRPALANPFLDQGNDQASMPMPTGGRLVMTTDGHVVSPLVFPGGDIGALAVHGTINDVAMAGAVPLYLSASFIIEEGFPLADLARIVGSMAAAARDAGVPVVAGDTKVVERGKADGLFISTAGVGVVPDGLLLSGECARPGDRVVLSGSIGEHGIAILSCRESLGFDSAIISDCAPLHGLVAAMVAAAGDQLRLMRDPTRGGVAATLNEIARQSAVGMMVEESAIPVLPQVAAVCELLGLDPLTIANEGKLLAIVAPDGVEALLAAMRAHPLGRRAAEIGTVIEDDQRFVQMNTAFGGRRIIDWLAGDQLPRIC